MAGVLRWEDPPRPHRLTHRPRQRPQYERWELVAAQLRARPGEWGVVSDLVGKGGGIAGQIKAGSITAFRPARTFEATTRTGEGRYTVYARYVGEPAGGNDG